MPELLLRVLPGDRFYNVVNDRIHEFVGSVGAADRENPRQALMNARHIGERHPVPHGNQAVGLLSMEIVKKLRLLS
ncbi:MAG: hypothetical protein AAFV29_20795, partial [Myxococcota bacterium]